MITAEFCPFLYRIATHSKNRSDVKVVEVLAVLPASAFGVWMNVHFPAPFHNGMEQMEQNGMDNNELDYLI